MSDEENASDRSSGNAFDQEEASLGADAPDKTDGDEDQGRPGLSLSSGNDTSAEATGRYLPPHLRAAQLGEDQKRSQARVEEKKKLDRKVQGLVNKSVSLGQSGCHELNGM